MNNIQYILIFDSGVGGLYIYKKVSEKLPNYNYLYFFDNVFFPYSEKSEGFIVFNTLRIIRSIMKSYLLSLIIIACNTVSTIMLSLLRFLIDIPIVGVVPSVKLAVSLTSNGIIGLIATKNTVSCLYIRKLVKRFANQCKFYLLGSTELVHIAQNKMYGLDISFDKIVFILRFFTEMLKLPDVIVLGCTHYSFLLSEFGEIFGSKIKLIDSSLVFVDHVCSIIKNNSYFCSYLYPFNKVLCLKIDSSLLNVFTLLKKYGFLELEQLYF
ncbi:glutamate racemase [Candidatus Purcelliella pentastirinorum]|uniref:Glutamate racemase n=1 Tax=Candidatus Purcelliella pentastirinorum TaxID=472834 RepID=A0AAX3N7T5_9ENTR|nr:glutamate racemase [Candidatus Purcelliella pentastirinorum]WDI78443.1 glutamate racemase [Candidatus Purcelliella pentastirinorum]WDR80528.1 glutamate racemase [Candidatus Purcelliella pentastirinorum]